VKTFIISSILLILFYIVLVLYETDFLFVVFWYMIIFYFFLILCLMDFIDFKIWKIAGFIIFFVPLSLNTISLYINAGKPLFWLSDWLMVLMWFLFMAFFILLFKK